MKRNCRPSTNCYRIPGLVIVTARRSLGLSPPIGVLSLHPRGTLTAVTGCVRPIHRPPSSRYEQIADRSSVFRRFSPNKIDVGLCLTTSGSESHRRFPGLANVEISPASSLFEIAASTRRMILPERVFGMSGTSRTRRGRHRDRTIRCDEAAN
jgi:hypothetical protein